MKKTAATLCVLLLACAAFFPAFAGSPPAPPPGGQPGGPGGQTTFSGEYAALKTVDTDTEIVNETFASAGADENAVLLTAGRLTLGGAALTRTSENSSGGDAASFYGVGAALLATGGEAYVADTKVSTDAKGGAGLFAYGDGTVYAAGCEIVTKQDAAGGIHAAGGGTLYAWDLNVTTAGQSSAAIRSDRGGGTMRVSGGSYVSNGVGSPAVYCTADIEVADAALTANGSEAVCIEGRNSLRLKDCALSGNMGDDAQNDCTWTVIVYQSMSGDSEPGRGVFQMTGGSLTGKRGGLFYTTNTESEILLQNVELVPAENAAFLLRCTGNRNERGWGAAGANGANCVFTADRQKMDGDVVWDSVSTLDLYMKNGSALTGAFVQDENCAGAGGEGYANLYLSPDSTWIVTADSTLTALCGVGQVVDESGRPVTVKNARGDVFLPGESALTVTVEAYAEAADFSNAGTFADVQAAGIPEALQQLRAGGAPAETTAAQDGTEEPGASDEPDAADSELEGLIDELDRRNNAPLFVLLGTGALLAVMIAAALIARKKK